MKNESGFHPRGDLLLVRPLAVEEKSAGGIVIPQEHLDKEMLAQTNGVVIEIGAHAHKSPRMQDVEVGSLIIFARYAGWMERGADEKPYRLIRGDDVIALRDKPPSGRMRAVIAPKNAAFDIV